MNDDSGEYHLCCGRKNMSFHTQQKNMIFVIFLPLQIDSLTQFFFLTGLFSSKEYSYYINHSSEIHKRIIKIIHKRFFDSLKEILN